MNGVLHKLRSFFQALRQLPYSWAWITLMVCCAVLFSWWDELIIWGIGIAWDWRIIPIYYVVEYCVLVPLIVLLAKKTYKKLGEQYGVELDLKQMLIQSLKNSLPVLIYRKLKELKSRKGVKGNG